MNSQSPHPRPDGDGSEPVLGRPVDSDLVRAKQLIRQELRRRLNEIPAEAKAGTSTALRHRLTALAEWKSAQAILLFHPLPAEPDLRPLLRDASDQGRVVALPAFDAVSRNYLARTVCFIEGVPALTTGAFGIAEPVPESPVLAWNRLDFVAVPGLGFTPDGRRLGKGCGYYDRLLLEIRGFRCGIAWDEQVLGDLPTGPGDARLDCILTPLREWRCLRERA